MKIMYEGALPKGACGLPEMISLFQNRVENEESIRFTLGVSFKCSMVVTEDAYMTAYPDTYVIEEGIRQTGIEMLRQARDEINAALAHLVD